MAEDYQDPSDLSAFQRFLGDLQNYDLAYKASRVDLVELFLEMDAIDISDTPYGQFRQRAKAEEFENFDADTSGGSVSYFTKLTLKVPEIADIVQALTRGMSSEDLTKMTQPNH